MKITATTLKRLDACEGRRYDFRRAFPRGITFPMSEKNMIKTSVLAAQYHLPVRWAISEFLTAKARLQFREGMEEENRLMDTALPRLNPKAQAILTEVHYQVCVYSLCALLNDAKNHSAELLEATEKA